MEESAVYLKYSGQGFAHDAIAQALLQSRSHFDHWQSQSLFYPLISTAFGCYKGMLRKPRQHPHPKQRLSASAFHCDLQIGWVLLFYNQTGTLAKAHLQSLKGVQKTFCS